MKLSDISPIAGVMTGEGMMGKLAGAGGLGLLPALISRDAQKEASAMAMAKALAAEEEERKKEKAVASNASSSATNMKKGGAVRSSASKRADGIALRGKTRA